MPLNPPGTTTIDDPSNEPLYEVTDTGTTNDGRWAHGMVPLNPLTGFPMSPSTPTIANDVADSAVSGRVPVGAVATLVRPTLATRTLLTLRNLGPDDVDLGPNATVAVGANFLLRTQDAFDVRTRGEVWAISAGTAVLSFWEEDL